ncbi:hypothetical protein GEMRC1_004849 [Eukaryota sp. GEM-RC1]
MYKVVRGEQCERNSSFLNFIIMLVSKKNRLLVYRYLFQEGVLVAKKEHTLAKNHPHIEVPNLEVIMLMKSLISRNFVRNQFSWQWNYYFLTDEGINYLREYLHIPEDVFPKTLMREQRPAREPREGGREGGRFRPRAPRDFS